VATRAAVLRFKGAADPQAAGRELGVGTVVTGTVSRRGDRISISAELVEIPSGARLWGEKYDRPIQDLRLLPDSIAADIAGGVRRRLSR
jgi:TolB-like protein